jgi:hypothetical protein
MEYRLGPRVNSDITPFNGAAVRLADDARRCVVFFGLPKLKNGKEVVEYGGTGFFVRFGGEIKFDYLVTCRHVARELEHIQFLIRANNHEGRVEELPVDEIEWVYHPDKTVDVAVAEFPWPRTLDRVSFPLDGCLTIQMCQQWGVGPGDLAQIVGLYRLAQGKRRNTPVVHTGHIAMMPYGEKLPVKEPGGNVIEVEAYLVEAQTLEGLSGSPVFVRHSVVAGPGLAETRRPLTAGITPMGYSAAVHLFGLWQGAWDGQPGKILSEDRGESGKFRVPVGMGLVIPGDKILETILEPKLAEARAKAYQERLAENAAKADSALPTKADNPSHREDFTSLVGAASKKRPPADQT